MNPWLLFLIAAVVCVGLTPLARLAARYLCLYDMPGKRKAHQKPTPLLGGAALAVAFYAAITPEVLARGWEPFSPMFLGGLLVLALGLADDVGNFGVPQKLLGQAAVALAAVSPGLGVVFTGYPHADLLISMFWIVTLLNVTNFVDCMNGLGAGTVAAIGIMLYLISGTPLALALAGACVGFLVFNFRTPARIFMGDMGSMFLGLMLAIMTLRFMQASSGWSVAVAQSLLLMGFPLADACLVVAGRIAHHRPFWRGGPDHSSHRLVHVGLPVRSAVITLWLVAAAYGGLGLLFDRLSAAAGLWVVGLTLAATAVGLVLMLRVPIYDSAELAARAEADSAAE